MKKFGFLFVLVLSFSSFLFGQWHWQNPIPIGKPIHDMTFIDSLNGYVCGYGGLFLKTTNAGAHWNEMEIPSEGLIRRLYFLNKDIGWYLSYEDKALFKTTDAGLSWNFVSSFSPRHASSIWFVNETKGFAGGYYNLLKTSDGGITWSEDPSVGSSHSLHFVDQNIGFASTHNGIFKTSNGGDSWTFKGIPAFDFAPSKVFAYDQYNVSVIGTNSWISGEVSYIFYHSSNGGTIWNGKEFSNQLTDVYFESLTNGWVCSEKIFKTTDRGLNWDSTNTFAYQFDFKGTNSWSATINTISYSNDRWQSSTPQINGIFSGFLWDGCAKDTNVVFACGSNKTIIGTTDGGKKWSKYYSSVINLSLNGIIIKGEEIWAVGQQGMIVYSKDNGNSWTEVNIDGNWLSDITFISNGVGYIVGSYGSIGAIFTSLNGGDNWTLMESFPNIWSMDKIKFSKDKLGWAIGYPETIFRSTTNGRTWEVVVDTVFGVSNIAVSGDSAWVTYGNKILRTTDGGNTWESFKVFDYNTMIFSGCDIDFINSKIGYVSANDSRVFKSTNGGETWEPEIYPKGLDNFAMDFVNEEVGWVFGYPGIVLKRDPNFVSVDDPRFEDYYPSSFTLFQNFPNPFNPSTVISWQSPENGWQTLKVYDVLGNEIATLVDEYRPAGSYVIEFNATHLASGIYFYTLITDDFHQTKKLVFMK